MAKFLYVFNDVDKNNLLALGYNLLQSDSAKHIYVFENRAVSALVLQEQEIKAVPSDTMMF